MRLYLSRSLRYMLRMVVIIGLVFAVMAMLNLLETGGRGVLEAVLFSRNGIILMVVLVVLAAIYPKLAFTTVKMRADIAGDKKSIIEAMRAYGYSPAEQSPDRMVFRADKLVKKLTAQFDDTITMTQDGPYLVMEGLKKDVLRLEMRINAFILK